MAPIKMTIIEIHKVARVIREIEKIIMDMGGNQQKTMDIKKTSKNKYRWLQHRFQSDGCQIPLHPSPLDFSTWWPPNILLLGGHQITFCLPSTRWV